MSNGSSEQLHPLQNTWCIWEHKVGFRLRNLRPFGSLAPAAARDSFLTGEARACSGRRVHVALECPYFVDLVYLASCFAMPYFHPAA